MKKLFAAILLLSSSLAFAYNPAQPTTDANAPPAAPKISAMTFNLFTAVTVTGASAGYTTYGENKGFQAIITGTTPTATVLAQVSNDGINWVTICTFTLSATLLSDACGVQSPYPYIRGNITAITGTGAAVTLIEAE